VGIMSNGENTVGPAVEESDVSETKESSVRGKSGFGRRIYNSCTRTISRRIASGLGILLTLTGTLRGTDGGLPPLYTVKNGESYGISVGVVSHYKEGARHYGVDLSILRLYDGGKLNGVGVDIVSGSLGQDKEGKRSVLNGLEIGLFHFGGMGKDQLTVNGAQVGAVNSNEGGFNLQVGVLNKNAPKGERTSGGLGVAVNGPKSD